MIAIVGGDSSDSEKDSSMMVVDDTIDDSFASCSFEPSLDNTHIKITTIKNNILVTVMEWLVVSSFVFKP